MLSFSRVLTISPSILYSRSLLRPNPRFRHVDTQREAAAAAAAGVHCSIIPPRDNGATPPPTPAPATTTNNTNNNSSYNANTPMDIPITTAIGQVMAAQANFVRVKIERLEGSDAPPPQPRLLCVVRALLKKIKQTVYVGDHVRVVGIDWVDGRGMVEEVLPRESRLQEPPVANVNHIALVFSSAMPPLQPSAATRYLVTAEASGLPITVVLNKADLVEGGEGAAEEERKRMAAWGYHVISVSVVDERGLEELEEALRGRVTVVAGPSGAGKSSIINALRLRGVGCRGTLERMSAQPSGHTAVGITDGDTTTTTSNPPPKNTTIELQAVGSVSERIGRGKHTTRNVNLVEMGSGGLLVDTPGFNQPSVALPAAELGRHFPEIRSALEGDNRCAFSNCQHISEPGCVVRGDWERYELYKGLHEELGAWEEEGAKRATNKRTREGNVRMKSRGGGRMGMEAKLETKTHRRVSRRVVKQSLSELTKNVDDDDTFSIPSSS